MANHHMEHSEGFIGLHGLIEFFLLLPFLVALVLYLAAYILSSREQKPWPCLRLFLLLAGVFCAFLAITGPIAARAHMNFTAHMLSHLLLGMLAPLLMVLAAPMTLLLRTLNKVLARRLSLLLRSGLVRLLSNPVIASLLNIGGLWVLYTTNLYIEMQEHALLHLIVHLHIFIAGYLFTVSIIYIDPTPHRTSFVFRAVVLVTALTGHGILSKFIYAHPPNGVPPDQSETASMLMYYGGDVIDLFLIIVFCYQWYKATRPFKAINQAV
jgi:putative membrane protein